MIRILWSSIYSYSTLLFAGNGKLEYPVKRTQTGQVAVHIILSNDINLVITLGGLFHVTMEFPDEYPSKVR